MKVFDIKRNDECLCGSGKKYKKCCMTRVEQIEREILSLLTKETFILSEEREFIRVISILYGIDLSETKDYLNVEKLSKLIKDTWTKEENFSQADIIRKLEEIALFIFKDERLKDLRIPGDILIGINFEDDAEVEKKIDKLISSMINDQFLIENYLLEISYALQNYKFDEKELQNLFHLIGLAISDKYESLLRVIIVATMLEVSEALEEIKNISENDEEREKKFFEIVAKYPSFNEYISSKMLDTIEEDLNKVFKEQIDVPFLIAYLFFLKFYLIGLELYLLEKSSIDSAKNLTYYILDEILREPLILKKAYESILDSLYAKTEKVDDKNVKESFEKVLAFLDMPPTEQRIEIFKKLLLINIFGYLRTFPKYIEEIDETVEIEALVSNEFFNKYTSYLESNHLIKESNLLKKFYYDFKNKMNNLNKIAPLILEKIKSLTT